MNKIYSVLRIDSWNNAQEVYTGRIRDCKKKSKNYRGRIQEKRMGSKKLRLHINPKVSIVTGKPERKKGGGVKKYSRFFKPKKRSTHVDYYIKYIYSNAYLERSAKNVNIFKTTKS